MTKVTNELKQENEFYDLIESKRIELESIVIDEKETILYIRKGNGGVTFENNRLIEQRSIIEEKIKNIFEGHLKFFFCGYDK